jgi:hypothetical protein
MQKKRERIQKICGKVYTLLTIGAIAWAVFGAMMVLKDIWAALGLPSEVVSVGAGWFSFEAIMLSFENGGSFPIINTGWIPAGSENVFLTTIVNLFALGILLAAMLYIRSIFNDLRNGGSPFSRKISFAAYFVAGAMLSVSLHGDRLSFDIMLLFPAALLAMMGFIFDYGRILQEESDTTL